MRSPSARVASQPAVHQLKPSVLAHARDLGEGNIASASDANRTSMVTPGPLVYLSVRHQRVAAAPSQPVKTAPTPPSKPPPTHIPPPSHLTALPPSPSPQA